MTYRKRTLRKMPWVTRRLAKLQNDLEGLAVKLSNLVKEVNSLELSVLAEVPLAELPAPDRQPTFFQGPAENPPAQAKNPPAQEDDGEAS